jgi:hypothetical protein
LDQEGIEMDLVVTAIGANERDCSRRTGLNTSSRPAKWPHIGAQFIKQHCVVGNTLSHLCPE